MLPSDVEGPPAHPRTPRTTRVALRQPMGPLRPCQKPIRCGARGRTVAFRRPMDVEPIVEPLAALPGVIDQLLCQVQARDPAFVEVGAKRTVERRLLLDVLHAQ